MAHALSTFTCRLLFLPLLSLPLLSFGQETRKISKTDGPISKEIFYVLKSDKNVRHGRYEFHMGSSSQPAAVGYYTMGRQDSTWTEYAETGRVLVKGNFHDGQPVGVWSFYNRNGALEQQYDYTQHQVLLSLPEGHTSGLPVRLLTPTAAGQKTPDIGPQYVGGWSALQGHYGTLRYTPLGPQGRFDGEVKVIGTIGTDGKASGWRLVQNGASGSGEAMLEMLNKLPNDWIPAQVQGQPVAVEALFSLKFHSIQSRP